MEKIFMRKIFKDSSEQIKGKKKKPSLEILSSEEKLLFPPYTKENKNVW